MIGCCLLMQVLTNDHFGRFKNHFGLKNEILNSGNGSLKYKQSKSNL